MTEELYPIAPNPPQNALPLWTAMALGSFFLLMPTGLYVVTPLAIAAILWAGWHWGSFMGSNADAPDIQVALGLSLPEYWQVRQILCYSGTVSLLVPDGTLYASLLFGVGFLTVIAPNWLAPESSLSFGALLTAGPRWWSWPWPPLPPGWPKRGGPPVRAQA